MVLCLYSVLDVICSNFQADRIEGVIKKEFLKNRDDIPFNVSVFAEVDRFAEGFSCLSFSTIFVAGHHEWPTEIYRGWAKQGAIQAGIQSYKVKFILILT